MLDLTFDVRMPYMFTKRFKVLRAVGGGLDRELLDQAIRKPRQLQGVQHDEKMQELLKVAPKVDAGFGTSSSTKTFRQLLGESDQ